LSDKKIKGIDPFTGVFATMGQAVNLAMGGTVPGRDDVLRTEEGYIVDTCVAFDTGIWETGICPEDGKWIIVEQYHNRADAVIGHAKWAEFMKENPKRELKDIKIWEM